MVHLQNGSSLQKQLELEINATYKTMEDREMTGTNFS
jgi:hypothetical protein